MADFISRKHNRLNGARFFEWAIAVKPLNFEKHETKASVKWRQLYGAYSLAGPV